MTPRMKIFLYVAEVIVLSTICLAATIFAVVEHSFTLMVLGVLLVIATTFFASSSKFAKEVIWIRRWRRVIECSIDEYPQTPKQSIVARRKHYTALFCLATAVNEASADIEAAKMGGKTPEEIADLMVEECVQRMKFLIYWKVLRHVGALPIDLRTAQPWGNHQAQAFLAFIKTSYLSMSPRMCA